MGPQEYRKIKSTFIKSNNQIAPGLACLASVIKFYGGKISFSKFQQNSGYSAKNVSLLSLSNVARTEGLQADGYKGNTDFLKELEQPAILHIERDSGTEDFVVFYGWGNRKFIIGDPQWGILEYREEELEAVWKSKVLLLLEPDEEFITKKEKANLKKIWLQDILKGQKTRIMVVGALGFVAATLIIVFLPSVLKIIGITINNGNGDVKFISLLRILVPFIVFAGFYFFNQIFIDSSISGLSGKFFSKITESIFNREYTPSKVGTIQSLIKAAREFSQVILQLAGTLPLLISLFVVSLFYIFDFSVLLGNILAIALVVQSFIAKLYHKKYVKLVSGKHPLEIRELEIIRKTADYSKQAVLTNRQKEFIHAIKDVLRFSENSRTNIKKLRKMLNRWFYFVSVLVVFVIIFIYFFKAGIFSEVFWLPVFVWGFLFFWTAGKLQDCFLAFLRARISFHFLYENLSKYNMETTTGVAQNPEKGKMSEIEDISVKNLSFAFPGRLHVLNDICLRAPRGTLNVIYGGTGSGKSVLVSTLCRVLPVVSGKILVNGRTWEQFNNYQWREIVSVVLQAVKLLRSNVIQNIGWGAARIEPEKVISFCKKTGFDQFFEKFPDGYATRADKLSAGQKQLVALAAAFYRKPQILLLDEPFVFMDKAMKAFCEKLLQSLKEEMIIVVFTGDRDFALKADNALWLENGRLK